VRFSGTLAPDLHGARHTPAVRSRNRAWAREHQIADRDRAWFEREIAPKLQGFPLSAIARATGLSPAACSRVRAGSQIPHPGHWDALLELVEAGNEPAVQNELDH
jgi:hypothetical protein